MIRYVSIEEMGWVVALEAKKPLLTSEFFNWVNLKMLGSLLVVICVCFFASGWVIHRAFQYGKKLFIEDWDKQHLHLNMKEVQPKFKRKRRSDLVYVASKKIKANQPLTIAKKSEVENFNESKQKAVEKISESETQDINTQTKEEKVRIQEVKKEVTHPATSILNEWKNQIISTFNVSDDVESKDVKVNNPTQQGEPIEHNQIQGAGQQEDSQLNKARGEKPDSGEVRSPLLKKLLSDLHDE